jgi:ribose-phosphate pyrophosphokinase
MNGNFRLFGLNASKEFAKGVADYLDVELSKHVEEYFADHENYLRSEVNVRDCDVFVIQSLYHESEESVADKFVKLLCFIGSLRDASARRITAVVPYLAFSRQDRKTESRAPITTKYVAKLIEAAGADRLLTMDVHNLSAFQNAFRIQTDNLEAKNLIADYVMVRLAETKTPLEDLVVLSPDSGGMGRAKRFRNALVKRLEHDVGLAYLDKTHEGKLIQGQEIIGHVKDKYVIIIDDMISSGSTLVECNRALKANGGQLWAACATHGLFVGRVNENLSSIDCVIITDTIMPYRLDEANMKKLHVIPTSRMFGQAIRRTHEEGGSISDLLK